MTCQAEKSFFFGKKTTCLSTFRISHISHFRKSSRSKDWMGSISSSPICWFFQHLKHLNSTISCSPCPALIYRPRLQWMGISANYPCLSTHFVLWYLFIYIQVYTILIYLSSYIGIHNTCSSLSSDIIVCWNLSKEKTIAYCYCYHCYYCYCLLFTIVIITIAHPISKKIAI